MVHCTVLHDASDSALWHSDAMDDAAQQSGVPPPLAAVTAAMSQGAKPRKVVLVEGVSDQVAIETMARRSHHDIRTEGILIVPIGGATNIRGFLDLFGPRGYDVSVAGLCDAAEEGFFRRGLESAGLGATISRADMEEVGFYVCVEDLEDELIRCLGSADVERIIDSERERGALRTFEKQPAQQGRSRNAQLRRFMGTRSGRKIRYARLLVEALDMSNVPRPLRLLLARL
jgi:hypothetical protein